MLGGLGLRLARGLDVGEEGDVNKADVVLADFQSELAERLDEKQPLHVADGAANFGDEDIHVGIVRGDLVHPLLDFVGDMGNELDGLAEIFAFTFFLDYGIEHLAGGEIVHLREHTGGETLVVAEVEVGLRSVIEHIDLAVLVGRHGAGIDVEVGVEFLHQYLEPTGFEESADGGRSEAFSSCAPTAAENEQKLNTANMAYFMTKSSFYHGRC